MKHVGGKGGCSTSEVCVVAAVCRGLCDKVSMTSAVLEYGIAKTHLMAHDEAGC